VCLEVNLKVLFVCYAWKCACCFIQWCEADDGVQDFLRLGDLKLE